MHSKHILIVLAICISFVKCAVHFERIYGVADEDLGKYQRTPDDLFHCLDGNGVIPYSALNDDYCDCADGSDEPGTPACPNSKFYCENHGSKGNFIPSSRVNDGVCDYDLCCDGSDEYNGIIICPDRCEEMAQIEKQERKEKLTKLILGYQQYNIMLFNAIANVTRDSTEMVIKHKSYAHENLKLNEIKDKIKELEAIEKETKDFYKSLYRELRTEYKESQKKLKKAIEDILKVKNNQNIDQKELNDIFNDYNENLLKNFEKPNPQNFEENSEKSDDDKKEVSNDNDKEEVLNEDEEEKRLIEEKRDVYNKLRNELSSLRIQRNDLDRSAKGFKREFEEIKKKLEMDSGKNSVFYTIYGETFTLNTTDYIYTLVWGKEIKQKQIKGGTLTLLGKFKEFRNNYKVAFYDEGAQCWNGPKRSVTINLICAPENEILKIDEPNKCEYVVDFATPGVCDPEEIEDFKKGSISKEDNSEFSDEMIESIKAMLKESPTQAILDEDEVLGKEALKENNNDQNNQNEQKHDEL